MTPLYTLIGLGLMGGSLAKAIKKYNPRACIQAMDPDSHSLHQALSEGVIDRIISDLENAVPPSDIVFLCAPVKINEGYLASLGPLLKKEAILTDIGSTKTSIQCQAMSHELGEYFIGGHPMAGLEHFGYSASDPLLLENAYYILTPSPQVSQKKIEILTRLLESCRAIPLLLNSERHDQAVAMVSHLPHVIAASLVTLLKENDDPEEIMKQMAAGGFKDITRIASSSPQIWEQICLSNQEAILVFLEKYMALLEKIKGDLEKRDASAIRSLFQTAGAYRNSMDTNARGLLPAKNTISVNVEDHPGSISIISSILASRSISIKNMGINHNRELGEGSLNISFYTADSCDLAQKVLKKYGFTSRIS